MRPQALHPGAIQGEEGIKFCHLATLLQAADSSSPSSAVDPASRLMAGLGISGGGQQTEGNNGDLEDNGETTEDEAGMAARIRAEEQARMKVRLHVFEIPAINLL